MSKKRKIPKRTSARGHVEGNVVRFQLKQELIRTDRDGNPIKRGKMPINTFSKDWLSSHLNPETSAPPTIPTREPPPNNVTSITKGKPKVRKPEPQPGNEARQHTKKFEHGWLHNKSLAIDEFRQWSRLTKEIGRKRCGSELWIQKDNKKLSSPSLEKQRELSKQGHKRLKFKKPPSSVHNPFLKPDASGGYSVAKAGATIASLNMRNRIRMGLEPLAPSGKPICDFVTGKYKPIENAVVYTTDAPPTATRHWRADAANDAGPHTLDKARATRASVQWFINHVEVQNWPSSYYDLVRWTKDGPVPNVGAINKAVNDPTTELALLKQTNAGLEKDWRMMDAALADMKSENNLLRQELELTQQELASERQSNKLMEYHIAQSNGVDPDIVRDKYVVKSKTPQIPDDVDGMLFQYRMYQSFKRTDGEEVAYARFVYGDPALGKIMREHADARCAERQADVEYRNLVRFLRNLGQHILSTAQAEYEQQKYDEYVNFWLKKHPLYLLQRQRRKMTAVRDPARESVALAAIARKGKPRTERSSLYYSTLDGRSAYLTSAVAKHIIQGVKPTRCRYNNPRLVEHDSRKSWAQPTFKGVSRYEKWWAERLDYCEVRYHEVKHPIKVGVVKSYNWVVGKLNTPVDPATRSRHKQLREQIRQRQHELDEMREQRKEERAAAKQRKAERDHIRKMQRIAH